MCLSVFQNKKKRVCVAGSLHILKLNSCNKVNNKINKQDFKHASYERFLQKKRCL